MTEQEQKNLLERTEIQTLEYDALALKIGADRLKSGVVCPIYFENKKDDESTIIDIQSAYSNALNTNGNSLLIKSLLYNKSNININDYMKQLIEITTNKIINEIKINTDSILYNGIFSFMKPLLLHPENEQEIFFHMFAEKISSFVINWTFPYITKKPYVNQSIIGNIDDEKELVYCCLFSILDDKTNTLRYIIKQDIPYVIHNELSIFANYLSNQLNSYIDTYISVLDINKFTALFKKIDNSHIDSEDYNRLQIALIKEINECYCKIMEIAEFILYRNLFYFVDNMEFDFARIKFITENSKAIEELK